MAIDPKDQIKPEKRGRQLGGMGAAAIIGAAAAHLAGRYIGNNAGGVVPIGAPPQDSLDVFDRMVARAATEGLVVSSSVAGLSEAPAAYPTSDGEYQGAAGSVGTAPAQESTDTADSSTTPPRSKNPPVTRTTAAPADASQGAGRQDPESAPVQTRGAAASTSGGPAGAINPPLDQPTSTTPQPSANPPPVSVYPPSDGTGPAADQQTEKPPAAGAVNGEGTPPPKDAIDGQGGAHPSDPGNRDESPPPIDPIDGNPDAPQSGHDAPVGIEEAPFSFDLDLPDNLVIARLSPMDFYRLVHGGELDQLIAEALERTGIPVTPETTLGLFNAVTPLAVARRYDRDGDDALDVSEAAVLVRNIAESQSFNDWLAPQPDSAGQVGDDDVVSPGARYSVDDTYEQIERGLWADDGPRDPDSFGIWATDRAARAVVERYDRNGDGSVSGEEAYLLFLEQRLYGSAAEWATAITSDETLLSDYVLPPAGSTVYEAGPRVSAEIFMQLQKSGLTRYEAERLPDLDGNRVPPERWRSWIEAHAPQELVDAYSGGDGMLSGEEAEAMVSALALAGWDYAAWEANYAEGPSYYPVEALHGLVSTGQWVNVSGADGEMGPSPATFAAWLEHSADPRLVAKYDRDNDGHLSAMEAELMRRELVSYDSPAAYAAAINSDFLVSEYVLRPTGEGLPPLSLDAYFEIERRGLVRASPDESTGFTSEFRVEWMNREAPLEAKAAFAGTDGVFDASEVHGMEGLRETGVDAWEGYLRSFSEQEEERLSARDLHEVLAQTDWPDGVETTNYGPRPDSLATWLNEHAPEDVLRRYDRDGDGMLNGREGILLAREIRHADYSPDYWAQIVASGQTLLSDWVLPPPGFVGLAEGAYLPLETFLRIEQAGLAGAGSTYTLIFSEEERYEWLNQFAPREVIALADEDHDGRLWYGDTHLGNLYSAHGFDVAVWQALLADAPADGSEAAAAEEDEPAAVDDTPVAAAMTSENYFNEINLEISASGGTSVLESVKLFAPQEVRRAFSERGAELSDADAANIVASIVGVEGDAALWVSALQNSPLPGHDRQLSMEEMWEAIRHKQLEAVLQAWSAEHDGTASQILPSEFQELSTLGPEDRLFLASLRSRVEEGMSYEHFEESVRLRLEPAPAALRDDESDLPQPRRTSFDDEQDSWLPVESQDIEDRKNDEEMDGL